MSDHEGPDLEAMLGGLMAPEATAHHVQPSPPVIRTVAEVRGETQGAAQSTMPAAAGVAIQLDSLRNVASQKAPREYAEDLGRALAASLEDTLVEDTLCAAAVVMFERIQAHHPLISEAEALNLTQRGASVALSALIESILSNRMGNAVLVAESQYRTNAILDAITEISKLDTRGATVAKVLNRLGRQRWQAEAVQLVVDNLLDEGRLVAIAPEPGPGRKSVRYLPKVA